MELEVIVESPAAGKLAEVRDVDGGTLAVQTNANRALGRRENGDLVALDYVLGGVEGIGNAEHVTSSKVVAPNGASCAY